MSRANPRYGPDRNRIIPPAPDVKVIKLPSYWKFTSYGAVKFDSCLSIFEWDLENQRVDIDMRECHDTSYQTMSLLVLYTWHLKNRGCDVRMRFHDKGHGASKIWSVMGANGLFFVLRSSKNQFRSNVYKPLLAIRNHKDIKESLEKYRDYTRGLDIEYEKTLSYIIAELLYNTLEHGKNAGIPSIIQFVWYREKNELSFLIADLGVGVRNHLRRTHPELEDDITSIKTALLPSVSGTFFKPTPYEADNNAGWGLYLSTKIARELHADMHIVSGKGVVHISPADITGRDVEPGWPGTFVSVTLKIKNTELINLQKMLAVFRTEADEERSRRSDQEKKVTQYIGVQNSFTSYAEDKVRATRMRDVTILPALESGKTVILDFEDVVSSPHSFLNALLSVPIRKYGVASYKRIKFINCDPSIRETIDFILEENT